MNRFLLFILINIISSPFFAQTKTSNGSGNWNNANTWTPNGVPTASDDVLITGNHRVDIVSNSACRSLTVGTGGGAQLRFDNGTNLTFTVSGNVIVANGAQFRVRGANATHTLFVGGNITNNGTINFYRSANRNAELILIGNSNQNVSGAGVLTQLHLIKLNMGNTFNNIADFSTTSFVVNPDFLTLTNGTFKYSKAAALNITPFNNAVTIPSTAGFWMNAPTSVVDFPAGIVVAGKLTNSNGTLSVGNANNEELLYSSGTFSFTGGVTNIAGRFCGNTAASTCVFSMSGGTVNVPNIGSTNSANSPFHIPTAGSQFNMSGGVIIIPHEGNGSGSQDLGYVNLSGSGSVTGGTLQIGTTVANQIMKINATASIPNLLINNSTATASLVTNSMNVVNNIVINSGSLTANNLNISLGGNWQNNGGTFSAGTGSVTFNSTTAQTIFKSGGETFNHLVFNGSGAKSLLAPVTASGNITINTGSNFDVSTSNHSVTVKGNFMNSGTFNAQSGLVRFDGTLAHTIGGNSVTNFYDITLSNTANGANLTQAENLLGTLTLSGGVFNTNSQVFTMVSTATATARIAQITGTGDITGNVTVQRFAPGGTTGWALLGTPISSALSLNDWDDDIYISCPTCPDGNASNFLSIYTYDETAAGTYSDALSYIPLSTINDPIISNKGYWVYLGDGFTTTNNITLDVTGSVRKFNQTIPLSITSNAGAADIGWNLIHNPYPSAISWAALKGTTSNIDNAIYTYNADLNGGAGGNATYVNGVSSPAVGSGGIGDVIPMCQGFYVHSTGATALSASESIKVAGNPTFLRTSNQSSISLVRLNLTKASGYKDESVVYIQPGATASFDPSYDAIKMSGQDPYAPTISIENGADIFQIQGIPTIAGTYTTYVKTLTGYSGSYTISASDLNSFPVGTCFKLFDRFTSTTTDLTNSNYVFNLADTTTVSRFILSITLNPLQITSNVGQPTCSNVNGGYVTAKGLNAGPWNYYWKDANQTIIKTALNKATADTLTGLWNGSISLDITTVGGCDNNQSNYTIIQQVPAYASFNSVDTAYINIDPVVQFQNTSLNQASQQWDFGDNTGISTSVSPSHQYQATGNFPVKLFVSSNTGCTDSIVKTIVVLNKPVGIKTNQLVADDIKIKTLSSGKYLIEKELQTETKYSYRLMDITGRTILNKKDEISKKIEILIDLNAYGKGVYFLNLQTEGKETTFKLNGN